MKITEQQLRRCVPSVNGTRVKELVAVMNEYGERFGINTPLRMAHALAQFFYESGELNHVVENLNYSADGLLKTFPKYFKTRADALAYARKPEKIANRVYANRMGNGSEASGDGWRYRGRGIVQLTGKAQYQAYQNSGFCVGNLVAHPEWLEKSPGAYKSALWFWYKNGCNELADKDDLTAITRRINGGTNGLSTRGFYLRRFKKEFGI